MFTEQELQKEVKSIIDSTDQLIVSLQQITNRLLKKTNSVHRRMIYTEPGGRVWYLMAGGSFKLEGIGRAWHLTE